MKPTEEQIKEFWEWCGLNEQPSGSWYTESGEYVYMQIIPIDLNNLFKYAEFKAVLDSSLKLKIDIDAARRLLFEHWLDNMEKGIIGVYVDRATALFWAIWSGSHQAEGR